LAKGIEKNLPMKNPKQNATGSSAPSSRTCHVCQKPLADNAGFRRLANKPEAGEGDLEIFLCSPVCALRYLGDSEPGGKRLEPNYDGYEHSRQRPVHPGTSKARNVKNSGKKND